MAAAPSRTSGDAPSGLAAGTIIAERYEILELLGEGGMGSVYKAKDHELDRIIALKTIRPDLSSNTMVLRRFKQELLLARQITHPNVIRIFDLGVAGSLRFITMEFVDGEDLKSVLRRRGKLPPREAARIVQQICAGLEAAHAEDVIHRDLKPQNVLIDGGKNVRIMDFGLARSLEQTGMTRTGALIGTADYMAPEQARGEEVDARSDVFAVGVIFYELLTSELAFAAKDLMTSLLRRTRERATPPHLIDPEVPQAMSDVVMRCLEPDVRNRYQSAGEVIAGISSVLTATTSQKAAIAASHPATLVSGAMIGSRYRIEQNAGEGGMGKVYRATDLHLNRTVALKIIRPELAGDAQALGRLKQEILLASRVSHRNVLRIHDLGEAGDLRFISMAWVDGSDLDHFVRGAKPLDEPLIMRLAQQMCEGLEAAHREGIVHRDLKPRNILLDSHGNACISDFGVAQPINLPSTTQPGFSGEIAGSVRYMSPEQFEGKAVDYRSDIYSLGLILYELATGDVPSPSDSMWQTMLRRATEKPREPRVLNPGISEKLSNIILRCLEVEPSNRYQSASELLQDLRDAGRPKTIAGVEPIRPKNRVLYAAAGIVIVLVGISVALYKSRTPASTPPANTKPASASALPVVPSSANGGTQNVEASDAYLKGHGILKDHRDAASAMQALALFQQACTKDPNFALAWTGIADASMQLYRLKKDPFWSEKALAAAQTAQSKSDDLPEAHFALGGIYTGTGRPADAVKEIKRALELAPKSDDGYRRLANAYEELGQIQDAVVADQHAVELNPYYWYNHKRLGILYLDMGKTDEALKEFNRQIELNPADASGYLNKGVVLSQQGQWQDSLPAFQKAIELEPSFDAYANLGTAYVNLGKYPNAIAMYQRAVQLNPTDIVAVGNLAEAYRQSGQKVKAQQMYGRAIALGYRQLEVNAHDASTLATLAVYCARIGRFPEAEQLIGRAHATNANDNSVLYDQAVVDALSGHPIEALATLKDAVKAGSPFDDVLKDPDLANVRALPAFHALYESERKSTSGKS